MVQGEERTGSLIRASHALQPGIHASAARELKALDRSMQRRIATRIEELAGNAYPPDVKKLRGSSDLYRIRVGEYRVIYRVEGKRVTIVVVKIGHRREVYR